jgi:hypothetical protein
MLKSHYLLMDECDNNECDNKKYYGSKNYICRKLKKHKKAKNITDKRRKKAQIHSNVVPIVAQHLA